MAFIDVPSLPTKVQRRQKEEFGPTSAFVAPLIALWLGGLFLLPLATSMLAMGTTAQTATTLVAISWPLFFKSKGAKGVALTAGKHRRFIFGAVLVAGLFAAASVVVSVDPALSLGYLIVTIVGLIVCARWSRRTARDDLQRSLRIYSLIMIAPMVVLATVAHKSARTFVLESTALNPNALAITAFSVAIAALAHRRWYLIAAAIVPPATLIYVAQSRTSIVALAIGLCVWLVFDFRASSVRKKLCVAVLAACAIAWAAASFDRVSQAADDVLLVNDEHRGVESGASGRLLAWEETYNMFLEHPVAGVGFRAHEKLITAATSSHNGYLALLAEIGLFGFAAVMCAVGIATWDVLFGSTSGSMKAVLLAFLAGYAFIGIFERYLINVGNPTSVLFLFILGHQYWAHRVASHQDDQDS